MRAFFGRRFLLAAAVMVVLVACGPSPAGTREDAQSGARDFLGNLVDGRADLAWAALTPKTRQVTYGDDEALFAAEVADADWSAVSRNVPLDGIYSLDTTWEAHISVVGGSTVVPDFLIRRRIVAAWRESGPDNVDRDLGIVLFVQVTGAGFNGYVVPGIGLDERLN